MSQYNHMPSAIVIPFLSDSYHTVNRQDLEWDNGNGGAIRHTAGILRVLASESDWWFDIVGVGRVMLKHGHIRAWQPRGLCHAFRFLEGERGREKRRERDEAAV
jgi:hypothetical protein